MGDTMRISAISDDKLREVRDKIIKKNGSCTSEDISNELGKDTLDPSTIRGRFIQMGLPLSKSNTPSEADLKPGELKKATQRTMLEVPKAEFVVPDELKRYIPPDDIFVGYIERPIDKRLALAYNLGKHPITQGKQGTGKTFAHMYYACTHKLPFALFSCYDDFRLAKLFGDKTIIAGTIKFQESEFVKMIQHPCCILFDEINAVSNANTFDFHALLQNRELFIKDANDGKGKYYKLHPECRIGFAQNPKSAKYIGGNIKGSNFLGRCTYITFPEFTKNEMDKALSKRYPTLSDEDRTKFVEYYFAICETIDQAQIPVDISIRQLTNVIDLWMHGLDLKHSIEDGMASILEAVSQPKAKDSFLKIAQAVWKELMNSKGGMKSYYISNKKGKK